jgi:DNA-binding NarL/FixJ family response regulator
VILDLIDPSNDGLQAVRELRRLFPGLPLVVFRSFQSAHHKRDAMDAGVSSLFWKSEQSGTESALFSFYQICWAEWGD